MPNNKGMKTPSKVVLDKIKINLNEDDSMYLQFERPIVRGELIDNIQVLGTFPNVEAKVNRFRKSTGKTNLKLAIKEAKELAKREYKYRLSYGQASKNLSNQKLIEEYVAFITRQTEKEMMMNRNPWNADNLKKHKGNALNHILPHLPNKNLSLLNRLDIQNLVATLKKTKSVKTIANVRTTFNQIWDYADSIGLVQGNPPKFPTLSTKKHNDEEGYGFATSEQVLQALKDIESELKRETLTKAQKHKLFVYKRWLVFLTDCGFRPFYKPGAKDRLPLTVEKKTNRAIFFKRYEKKISYIARGGTASLNAVNELEEYYNDMGIKNEELIVNLDGKPFTKKAWELLGSHVQEVTGWNEMSDRHGRPLVPYSIRHHHITYALDNREDIHKLAKRCGTSVEMIMKVYYEHDFFNTEKTDSILEQ